MNSNDDLLEPFRAVGRGETDTGLNRAILASVDAELPLAAPASGSVLLAGDLHGNVVAARQVLYGADMQSVRTVVQLGDFGFWSGEDGETYLDTVSAKLADLDQTLLVIDGNHEDFDLLERFPTVPEGPAVGLRPVRPRLWHLPRGTRWQWPNADGSLTKWAAAGGAVSVDRAVRTLGYSFWPAEELTDDQVDLIAEAGPVDVLLCHDRPAAAALALGDVPGLWWWRTPSFWARDDLRRSDEHAARLQRLIDTVHPTQVWHGHLHQRTEVTIDPAAWGGTCHVHGLADDGVGTPHNIALVGTDGALIELDGDSA
jgi:hypothetical protein